MIRLFKHYVPYAVLLLGLCDVVLLFAAAEIAWTWRLAELGSRAGPIAGRWVELAVYTVGVELAIVAVGVYGPKALASLRFATARLLVAVSLGVLGLSALFFLVPGLGFWRSNLLYAMVVTVLLLVGVRVLLGKTLGGEVFRRRIVVLGAGARAQRIRQLGGREGAGFSAVGFVAMNDGAPVVEEAINRSAIASLSDHMVLLNASEVVLAMEERRNALPLSDLVRVKTTGLTVSDFSTFLERETGRVDLDSLNPSWLIFSDGFSSGRTMSAAVKRVFDVVVSALLLLLTAPLIVLFAVAVKLESRGPAFFRQRRVGLFGEPFTIIKLRSMAADAEKDGQAVWAAHRDPRVTRMGRIIRATRIDELPQTLSVLRGDMSFVGPRPERPEFVDGLAEKLKYYGERHMVKPGITGWAQINYPYGASLDDARNKLEYDLYYAKNYSPFLDLLILLQTVRVVLWPEGVR